MKDSFEKNRGRYIYLVSLICIYTSSFLIHISVGIDFVAHPKLYDQIIILLIISFLLAIIQTINMPTYTRFILLVIQGIINSIIGYSFGTFLVIETLLIVAYLYAIQIYFNSHLRYIFSAFVIFGFIVLQRPASVYGIIIEGPNSILTISAVMIMLSVVIIGDFQQRLIDKKRLLEKSNSFLGNSIARITGANINYQDYLSEAETNAASKERLRITRDLHDALGYAFSNILLIGRLNLKMYNKDDEIQRNLEKICNISQTGIQEMRRILRFFRRSDMGQLTGAEAITQLVNDFSYATGSSIRMEYTNARWKEGTNLDDMIYRFIQEGLVNAFRHGVSKKISINFWQDTNGLSITISNNSRTNTSLSEGIGIQGMRERISGLNGSLSIKYIKGMFQICAQFPKTTEGLI